MAMTSIDLSEWVKRQLGYPTRNIELTDEQLEDVINFALLEIQPWFSSQYYLTMDLNNQSAIKLSEILDKLVYEVTDVILIPTNLMSQSVPVDPFNGVNYNIGGFAVGGYSGIGSYYYSNLTNTNIHYIIGAYARQRNELFYSRLANLLYQKTMGTISPSMSFEFHRDDQILYLGLGYPSSSSVTIEYVPLLTDLKMVVDERYIRCAQDLALGQALVTTARITGKFSISNAPTSINYSDMREEGLRLIEDARKELKRVTRNHVIID